jgi:beta-lactamase regulating signal transducer with metallopeptidase domain
MTALFDSLLAGPVAQALGWTIVHSLWQASAVALVLFIILKFFRNGSSQWKYTAGVVALVGTVLVSVLTFTVIYRSLDGAAPGRGTVTGAAMAVNAINPASISILEVLKQFVDRHVQLLVFFWALGVIFLILRMTGGLFYNHRLKTKDVSLASEYWQERLDVLCNRAGMLKSVVLKESLLARVPMTVGHLKPVIFFPVGVLTGLPHEQVEALLAHELAHIVRSDYLVNIFQGFVDIFYFYHPAVYWISGIIRQEREHCCDDMAVGMLGDSFHFARALANVHSWGTREPAFAMTLAKDKHRLFNRIRRIINMKKEGTHSFEGFVGACVLGVLLIVTGFSLGTAGVLNDNAGVAAPVPADKDKPVAAITKKMVQKEDSLHIIDMRATGKDGELVKIIIKNDDSGKVLWKMKEKIKGESFAMQTKLFLKKGTYAFTFTPNMKVRLKLVKYEVPKGEEEIVKYKKVYQEISEKMKKLENKGSDLTADEKEVLEKLKKKTQYLKQKIKTYYKEQAVEAEKDKEKIRVKRLKEMELKKLELKKLYKRKQALESEKKLSKKQKEELEKVTALLLERKREYEKTKIAAEEKRQAKLAARKQILEEKLKKVTQIIQEWETKEGELSKEEKKKLQKFRQMRESLLTEIKK